MRDCTRLSALRVLFNGLSIEQYNILVKSCLLLWRLMVFFSATCEGFTGFQGTVLIGLRLVLERPVQALRVLFNGI